MKNAMGILTDITLNLQIALGSMLILTILILPIQEHDVIFPSVCVDFNFFHQCHIVFCVQVFYLPG